MVRVWVRVRVIVSVRIRVWVGVRDRVWVCFRVRVRDRVCCSVRVRVRVSGPSPSLDASYGALSMIVSQSLVQHMPSHWFEALIPRTTFRHT
jgi:hypothetical protein